VERHRPRAQRQGAGPAADQGTTALSSWRRQLHANLPLPQAQGHVRSVGRLHGRSSHGGVQEVPG